MSTLRFDTLDNSVDTVDTNTIVSATPRAWNYYDEAAGGSILNSYNVSTLVDNGTGIFTSNLTSVLPNTNYAVFGKAAQKNSVPTFPGSLEDASSTGSRPDSTSAYTVTTQDNDSNARDDFNFCSTAAIS